MTTQEARQKGAILSKHIAELKAEVAKLEAEREALLPVDWAATDAAVERYVTDKTTVDYIQMWDTLIVEDPALDACSTVNMARYFFDRLRCLGFTCEPGGVTWRKAMQAAE